MWPYVAVQQGHAVFPYNIQRPSIWNAGLSKRVLGWKGLRRQIVGWNAAYFDRLYVEH